MPISLLLMAIAGYLIGSIPFGFLVGRARGIDIRRRGSGNIGATNIGRELGRRWGLLVLLLDAMKGYLPIWGLAVLTRRWNWDDATLAWYAQLPQRCALIGLAAIAGHVWPLWLGFRGGKGVATGLGVAAALSVLFPKSVGWPVATALAVWSVAALISRYISVASVLAGIAFGMCYLLTAEAPFALERIGLTAISLAFPLLVIIRHRSNIARLLRGEESKWGHT